ncbi:MAG: energy transducer TonB [Deltaproteobacteria bacterium]|jgi:protein TonB|nr:energy transducer TonB [Deltaproteobacteria bacterium]
MDPFFPGPSGKPFRGASLFSAFPSSPLFAPILRAIALTVSAAFLATPASSHASCLTCAPAGNALLVALSGGIGSGPLSAAASAGDAAPNSPDSASWSPESGEARTAPDVGGRAGGARKARDYYMTQVRHRIQLGLVYPDRARDAGLEGTATVRFIVSRNGRLVSCDVMKSSGHGVLDDAAIAVLRRLEPFPPFPPDVRDSYMMLTEPIEFRARTPRAEPPAPVAAPTQPAPAAAPTQPAPAAPPTQPAPAALPAAPNAVAEADDSAVINAFRKQVANRLRQNIVFPPAARESRSQGVVSVSFTIGRNGELVSLPRVVKTSRHPVLDEAALKAVRESAPFPAIPPEIQVKAITFTVPMSFTLNNRAGGS